MHFFISSLLTVKREDIKVKLVCNWFSDLNWQNYFGARQETCSKTYQCDCQTEAWTQCPIHMPWRTIYVELSFQQIQIVVWRTSSHQLPTSALGRNKVKLLNPSFDLVYGFKNSLNVFYICLSTETPLLAICDEAALKNFRNINVKGFQATLKNFSVMYSLFLYV